MPPSVTLSFDPYASDLPDWIAKARAAHHETLEGLSKTDQKRFIAMMQKIVAARDPQPETASVPD